MNASWNVTAVLKLLTVSMLTSCLLCGAAVAAEEVVSPKGEDGIIEQQEEPSSGWNLHVFSRQEYRLRTSTDPSERDQDIRLSLDFSAIDPSDRFGAELSMGFAYDLDGVPQKPSSIGFNSIYDENDPGWWFDIYTLALDYHSSGIVQLARAGRQVAPYGHPAVFDGVSFVLRPARKYLDLYLLGGRSVHFFDLDSDIFEDWLAAGGVVIRPMQDLHFELEYRFNLEKKQTPSNNGWPQYDKTDVTDHAFSFTGYYRYEDWLYAKAKVRTVNSDVAEASGSLHMNWTRYELGFQVDVKAQPSTLNEISEAEDPYFFVLGTSLPYIAYSAELNKAFSSTKGIYALNLGYEGRQLLKDNEQTFNRNYNRAYLLFSAVDIVVKGPFLSFVFERWADGAILDGNGLWTVGGSLGHDCRYLRAEVGSFYQRYKYTYYSDVDEIDSVRTVYADLKGKPLDWLAITARYELEIFDRYVHVVTVGLIQNY